MADRKIKHTVAATLRAALAEKGLSISELARRIRSDRAFLSRLCNENGTRPLNSKKANRRYVSLARVLGLPKQAFLELVAQERIRPEQLAALTRRILFTRVLLVLYQRCEDPRDPLQLYKLRIAWAQLFEMVQRSLDQSPQTVRISIPDSAIWTEIFDCLVAIEVSQAEGMQRYWPHDLVRALMSEAIGIAAHLKA